MPLEDVSRIIGSTCGRLLDDLHSGVTIPPQGLRRSARLPVLSAVYQGWGRPVLFITDRLDHALGLADELVLWLPHAPRLFFPEPTPLFYEDAAWGEATRRERLQCLTFLAPYHIPGATMPTAPPLIIAPVRALMTRTLPRREFLKATRLLKRGASQPPEALARSLLTIGFEPANLVIAPGQFARRGGIFDLWPLAEASPLRLEYFGDEIERIRLFDPATQRSLKTEPVEVERLMVTPGREFLAPATTPGKEPGASPSEFHIPVLHPMPASLLDYLPPQSLVVVDDRQPMEDVATEVEEQAVKMRQDFIRDGTLAEDFPTPYLTLSELQDSISGHLTLELGYPSAAQVNSHTQIFVEEQPSILGEAFMPGPRFGGRLKAVMEHLVERFQAGDRIVVVSRQAGRLRELWAEQVGRKSPPPFEVLEGSLAEGWVLDCPQAPPLHLLTDGEVFGWRRPETRRRPSLVAEAPEMIYADLQAGDFVVHTDHGIGRYAGLVRRTVEGIEREYLCIEYADETQLFVPIYQADRLTRYVGPDSRPPVLSRLGSPEWRGVKTHVKEAVKEVAEDLLELYARRSIARGYNFGPDTPWQQEMEASFPYIETEDQLRVLAEVKQDMHSDRPMDRLVCGDVGYGKTEVALRAAFKAVQEGKQVAVLVPTTVLAQQHFHTFQQRLAAFPVEVEMLSRFRGPQQQRDILKHLAQGRLDIVIGTHRLLSADVEFHDLGLLVVDEEQRFGVTHKETLKKMRTEVDVLTMTATPIPRTLYMALSGIRDISTINTPPEERLPIVTHIGPYSPKLVRQAILRELERGGQVFFVHNRVQTIEAMSAHLRHLVPEARLTIAHGQMAEHELEARMDQFNAGEVDILLSTSIIESGLDIPNANTLIVDRADTFGLAQLYQLRGRVGRGAQRAYAYFFRHNKKLPTLEGRLRLETIAENTQLGAGFSIAMRDLEIRGAGDILGTRQHGYIAAVGFHLYTALLTEAVRKLRSDRGLPHAGLPLAHSPPALAASVELPLPLGIPAEYVPDATTRLGLYRRLADLRSVQELEALGDEFRDRFGPLPETVLNLFFQFKVKLLAEKAGLSSIALENKQFALRFADGEIPESLPELGAHVRVGKTALWLPFGSAQDWPSMLVAVLEKLEAFVKAGKVRG